MVSAATRAHFIAFVVVLGVAVLLLLLLFPTFGRRIAVREFPIYFLTVALVPVGLWLYPPVVRALTRAAYRGHKALAAKDAAYVLVPAALPIRVRDTALMAIGPFAVDLFVMAEILFLLSSDVIKDLRFGLVAFPILLVLAGLLTSLAPAAWLLDALEVRVVSPTRGEIVRAAELYERILGPVGAVALLASFVTLLHTSGFSYEGGLFLVGLWAVRLFPPVFGAVCVYRVFIEPRVLPSLEAWCRAEGIETRESIPALLTGWAGSNVAGR